jgi:cytochrome c biogenesis protein CcdA
LRGYCIDTGISTEKVGIPFMVVGDKFLMGTREIKDSLEEEILKLEKPPGFCPLVRMSCHRVEYNPMKISPIQKIEVSLPLVIISGLIDGINPCAFAVLTFLLAFLLEVSSNRKRIIAAGSAYIFSVYVTYFLAGIGLLSVIQFTGMTGIILKVAAGIAIIAGLISIKDYFWYGKGISLKIPESKKGVIERWVHKANIPGALVLGFLVAMFELPCTGGIYLAILAMLADSVTKLQAVFYLLLYNLMFVLPLIVIFGLVYKGMEIKHIENWRELRKNWMKLVMGIFLLILGLIMLLMM